MSEKEVKKAIKNFNNRSLTNEQEIMLLVNRIDKWELEFLDIAGKSESQTRQAINEWLNEGEFIYGDGMIQSNSMAGFGGYGITRSVVNARISLKDYKEAYSKRILNLSNRDLTQARLLRNSLAFSLRDKWQEVYAKYDQYIKQSTGSLGQIKRDFMKKAVYQDAVFFVDSIGRQWRPTAYSEMWARTRSREIEDDLSTDEMGEFGLDIVKINNVSTTTPICLQYEGKYFSLNGATPELPILDMLPPFHPNCRHRKFPVREFKSNQLTVNSNIDKRVSTLSKSWSKAEKENVNKQKLWNNKNRTK